MISIVDYGVGNLGSIINMLKYIDVECQIVSEPAQIKQAQKIILPGVGNWDHGMTQLIKKGLIESLKTKVQEEKTPLLGICLGMQLLLDNSEEGKLPGLGLIRGTVKKFHFENGHDLRIPHMGWNEINIDKKNVISKYINSKDRFYFVHSYHAVVEQHASLYSCEYGYKFSCGIQLDNLWGMQFHPEKSHQFGMKILRGFSEI